MVSMIGRKSMAPAALLACAGLCVAVSGCASGPARTSAEQLTVSQIRAMTIASGVATQFTAQTITALPAIREMADLLNSLAMSSSTGATTCPGSARPFTITFQPRSPTGTPVTVNASSCNGVSVTAAGAQQPALADPGNQVSILAAQLAHTSQWES